MTHKFEAFEVRIAQALAGKQPQAWGIAHSGLNLPPVAGAPSADDPAIAVAIFADDASLSGIEPQLNANEGLVLIALDKAGLIASCCLLGTNLADTAEEMAIDLTPAARQAITRSNALNQSINRLLGAMLLGGRPVRAARLHCFVPMQFAPVSATGPDFAALRDALIAAAQKKTDGLSMTGNRDGAHYFLAHTHKLMLENAGGPGGKANNLDEQIVSLDWEHEPLALVVRRDRKRRTRRLRARMGHVRLHLYAERSIALEYELVPIRLPGEVFLHAVDNGTGVPQPVPFGESLWQDIALSGYDGPNRSVAAWLDYTEGARTLFSGFKVEPESKTEGSKSFISYLASASDLEPITGTWLAAWKLAKSVDENLRQPIQGAPRYLLERFLEAAEIADIAADTGWFELRTDDRARIVQSLVPCGDFPTEGTAAAQLPVIEARSALVDDFGTSHFYNQTFAKDEIDRIAYDRFRGPDSYGGGSRFFANDHAFSHVGFGWFAANQICARHMAGPYRRMALLLVLNAAALFGMLRELGTALSGWNPVHGGDDILTDKLGEMQRRYLKFLNLNWQEQVSSQIQGMELFDKMKLVSPATRELKLVDEQISRTGAYLTGRRETRRDAQKGFAQIMLALLALLFTLPGLLGAATENTVQRAINIAFGAGFAQAWPLEIAMFVAFGAIVLLDTLGLLGTPIRRGYRRWMERLGTEWQLPVGLLAAWVLPWLPLIGLRGSQSPCALQPAMYLAGSMVASLGLFWHGWNLATRHARRDDDLRQPLRGLYALFLGIYMLSIGLRTTGLL